MGNIEIKRVIAHHMDLGATKPTFLNNVIDISQEEMQDVIVFFGNHRGPHVKGVCNQTTDLRVGVLDDISD